MRLNIDLKMPLRQKILLGSTITLGFLVLILYHIKIVNPEAMDIILYGYFLLVPFMLLANDTLVDLNDNRIFLIWFVIGVIFFIIYLFVRNISALWVNSVKSLLVFLITYKPLNILMKKITGVHLINTFHQHSWKHDVAKRKITVWDVVFNMVLYLVTILSIFIK